MILRYENNRIEMNNKYNKQLGEVIRFGIVGVVATLMQMMEEIGYDPEFIYRVAYLVGHHHSYDEIDGLSFAFNFIASTRYTFRVEASKKRGAGFALSHAVNYVLQMLMLNAAIWLGVPKQWAPIPMFCVCVPVNFILVRYFLKVKK